MRSKLVLKMLCFFLTWVSMAVYAEAPGNFAASKKIATHIFIAHPVTLYCGCEYRQKSINLASCGMQSASSIKRAHRLEWEHMMPAENFGRQLTCWREKICVTQKGKRYKGRRCCDKQSQPFRNMESELYNLWPAVGLVNQARSNYRYSQSSTLEFQKANFYGCHILIDKGLRKVEPRDEAKGIVARANLFMAQKYDIRLSDSQRRLFEAWNKQYPPSGWEKTWAKKVETIEQYRNTFISGLL